MLKQFVFSTFISITLAVALVAVAPSPGEAQMDCVFCSDCTHPLTKKLGHFAWDIKSPMQANQRGDGTHHNCLGKSGQHYTCAKNHPPCGGIGGGPLYDATRHGPVLEAITSAVAEGDGFAAYRIVASQPTDSPFYFLAARDAIQVRGCRETVWMHIPLGSLLTEELLAAIQADVGGRSAP